MCLHMYTYFLNNFSRISGIFSLVFQINNVTSDEFNILIWNLPFDIYPRNMDVISNVMEEIRMKKLLECQIWLKIHVTSIYLKNPHTQIMISRNPLLHVTNISNRFVIVCFIGCLTFLYSTNISKKNQNSFIS